LNSYYLGLYEKSMPSSLSIREKLIEAKNSGFDFMEISIDETEEKLSRLKWNTAEKLEILNAISETGISVMTMCLSGNRKFPIGSEDIKIRNKGMEIISDAINLASDIGIRIIQIAGYDEYYKPSNENTKRLFLENLKISANIASKKGVILAFETMETEFINTVKKAMNYVEKIKSPFLQVYPDLGNITNASVQYKTSVLDDLKKGSGHIVAMHLKETVPGIFREVPYGTGHVDFDSAIKITRDQGVNLYVGEFWYVGNEDWKEQLNFANNFLRDKLRKYHKEG
jgi:L-ribulose-5-phosphate 3-epimerase